MRAKRALRFSKTVIKYCAVLEIYLFFHLEGGFLFLVIPAWIEAVKSGLKKGIARMVKVGQKQIPAWIEGGSDLTRVL
jgi:hypothetical protein